MQIASIVIGGLDWTPDCRLQKTEIEQDLGGRVQAAKLQVISKNPDTLAKVGLAVVGTTKVGQAIQLHDEVLVSKAAGRFFGGRVSKIVPMREAPALLSFALTCQDFTALLETVTIEFESFTSQLDTTIITYLFATYLPEINTTEIVSVATVSSLELSNVTLRQALDALIDRTGAEWFVDANKKLQYFASGSRLAPFNLSEVPNNVTTFNWHREGFEASEEFPTPANSVSVAGKGESESSSFLSLTDVPADNGYVEKKDTTFPPDAGGSGTLVDTTSANAFALNWKDGSVYRMANALMRFDTSPIPDTAVIQSATLKLFASSTAGDTINLGIEYYASANWPIDLADYTSTASNSAYGYAQHLNGSGASRTYELKNPDANINKTGFTGFRFHLFITGAGAPTGQNTLSIQTTGADAPVLEISYTLPTAEVQGSAEDATSQARYGVLKRILIDRSIQTADEANLRAQIEIARYATPQLNARLAVLKDGLDIGQLINIHAPSVGISGDLLIRRIAMRWIKQDITEYTLELGDYRPDLVRLLRTLATRQ